MSGTEHKARSRVLFGALIVGTIVAAIAFFPTLLVASMSLLAADAGGRPMLQVFLGFAWSLPVVTALGPILGWVAYGFRRERLSWGLLLAPAVWAAATFGVLAIVPD